MLRQIEMLAMKHMFAVIRLMGICAFLLVQAIQFDHAADQSLESQHDNCVICKNIGDSMAAADDVLIKENIAYNSAAALLLSHLIPASAPDRSLLTHGPPALT